MRRGRSRLRTTSAHLGACNSLRPTRCTPSKFTSAIARSSRPSQTALRGFRADGHARTWICVEIVVRRFGLTFERPLAVTECGGQAHRRRYNRIAAETAIINGEAGEMCPACKKKLEDKGVHDAPHPSD